jgi:hypothetical protein
MEAALAHHGCVAARISGTSFHGERGDTVSR